MEFEIFFYKDEKGNSPIEKFLDELEKTNNYSVAWFRQETAENSYKGVRRSKEKIENIKDKRGKLI